MTLVRGDRLSFELRAQILASYVHRKMDTTCKNDDEWLRKHAFYVTDKGELSRKHKHAEPAYLLDFPRERNYPFWRK